MLLSRGRARTALAYLLAVPIFVVVYLATAKRRTWTSVRPVAASAAGAMVIGSVYAGHAARQAGRTPLQAAVGLALAIALVVPGLAPAPAMAARNPAQAVLVEARKYLGTPYKLGTEGPNLFDCSGFIYRAFKDAGELPRIGGMRLRAAGYMRWFVTRGLFTRDEAKAEPGDLVVWNNGSHAGIYLGDGKAISALKNPHGITVHSIHGISLPLTYFLRVDWRNGDGGGDNGGGDNGGGDNGGGDNEPDGPAPNDGGHNGPNDIHPAAGVADPGAHALTTGTLNLRDGADPSSRIVGWVPRGTQVRIVRHGHSPSGWLWYLVETRSGKQGWIWSYWTRPT
jgi:cell wall-associated NlpC family hydrolase